MEINGARGCEVRRGEGGRGGAWAAELVPWGDLFCFVDVYIARVLLGLCACSVLFFFEFVYYYFLEHAEDLLNVIEI